LREAVPQIGRLKETVKIMIQSPFDVTSFDDDMARDGLFHFHNLLLAFFGIGATS
jgi:hypothetical protein